MAGCQSSETPTEPSKPVEEEKVTTKDYNIIFIYNDLIKAEWLYVEDDTYAIEITNQDYIGTFCLLPKENEVIPFDGENCVHTKHKHNNPELFKNKNVTINFITMTENHESQSPVISITSNNHTPIDWWMFIMDVTNDKGESKYLYGATSLYPFVDNGIRYITLYSDMKLPG